MVKWIVQNVKCPKCEVSKLWNVQNVKHPKCEMSRGERSKVWNVLNVKHPEWEYLKCEVSRMRMSKVWNVQNVKHHVWNVQSWIVLMWNVWESSFCVQIVGCFFVLAWCGEREWWMKKMCKMRWISSVPLLSHCRQCSSSATTTREDLGITFTNYIIICSHSASVLFQGCFLTIQERFLAKMFIVSSLYYM